MAAIEPIKNDIDPRMMLALQIQLALLAIALPVHPYF
jgi:hypothetical protein